jgi:hypothetical protein
LYLHWWIAISLFLGGASFHLVDDELPKEDIPYLMKWHGMSSQAIGLWATEKKKRLKMHSALIKKKIAGKLGCRG